MLGISLYFVPEIFIAAFELFIYNFYYYDKSKQEQAGMVLSETFPPIISIYIVLLCCVTWIIIWQTGKTCLGVTNL